MYTSGVYFLNHYCLSPVDCHHCIIPVVAYIYNIKRLSTHNVHMEIIQNLKVSPIQSRLSINNVQITIIQKVSKRLVDIKQQVFR